MQSSCVTQGCQFANGDGSGMQVFTDNDISTKFYWGRPFMLSPTSEAIITWEIPEDTPDGTYRIQHFGDYKQARPLCFMCRHHCP